VRVAVGRVQNVRYVEGKGLFGDFLFEDSEAGRWALRLVRLLVEQGLADAVGFAVEHDVRFAEDGKTVTEIVRAHGLHLVQRPTTTEGLFVGSGQGSRGIRRGDVDRVVGMIGPPPEGVSFLRDPDYFEPRRNTDGTWRVIEMLPVTPDPGKMDRLRRFAEAQSKFSGETSAIVGGPMLDRADEIAKVIRNDPPPDPRAAEKEARQLHDLGVAGGASRSVAENRHAGRARARAERDAALLAAIRENLDPKSGDDPTREAAAHELRLLIVRRIRDLRRCLRDPADRATLTYLLRKHGFFPSRSRGRGARVFAASGVTPKALRWRESRILRRLVASLRTLAG
jgi:hypothetical protein